MDPDRIPAEPTTAAAPPGALPSASGPSQVAATPAAGRGRRSGISGAVVGIALVATFSAGIGVGGIVAATAGGATTATPSPASTPGASAPTEFGLIREAWDTIREHYVGRDELDDRDLIYGAIRGMTEAVGDTGHTDFMTPEEREARNDNLSGSYVGIGVRMDTDDTGAPRIVEVFDESPADLAGLEDGDVIVAIDGQSTAESTLDEVAELMRGEAGTTVTVVVRADGTGPERTYDIVRGDVPIHPVSWAMVPGSTTALIRLEQFSHGAADDMVVALQEARAAGAQRVVLDLRGNPGGYVNEAVGIASQFLADGTVYVERDAAGTETPHAVTPDGVAYDLPLAVLVDGNSASSSEILAGALQDAGRATIIGETTYGTGTVLGEFLLSDGSALRVGTVEWLTPDGRRIWHEGIAPDVPVTQPEEAELLAPEDVAALTAAQVEAIGDAQLARALVLVTEEAVAGS